jgi:hypothetical protein
MSERTYEKISETEFKIIETKSHVEETVTTLNRLKQQRAVLVKRREDIILKYDIDMAQIDTAIADKDADISEAEKQGIIEEED